MSKTTLKPTYLFFAALMESLRARIGDGLDHTECRSNCFRYLTGIAPNVIKTHDLRASKGTRSGQLLSPKVGPLLTLAEDAGIIRIANGTVSFTTVPQSKYGSLLRDAHQIRARASNERRQQGKPARRKRYIPNNKIATNDDTTVRINGLEVTGSVSTIRELLGGTK